MVEILYHLDLYARYYDPKIRRFTSIDSQIAGVLEDVNGYNLFAYCNNNPVNCQDFRRSLL